MAGRLGCGNEVQILVVNRCGAPRVCDLTDASRVYFDRRLDDISEAKIEIPVSAGLGGPCCRCIGEVEPWCHELLIIRDGVTVWNGPIINITYGYNTTVVDARDMMAWATVRVPEINLLDAQGRLVGAPGGSPISLIAYRILQLAFADDNPCVMEFVQRLDEANPAFPNTQLVQSTLAPFEGSAFDHIQALAEIGLDWTVIGRSILLGGDDLPVRALGVLTDKHIMGEIEVSKDGFLMGNRFFVRYENDTDAAQCAAQNPDILTPPCPALAEVSDAERFCYGVIERVRTGDNIAFNYATAKATADAYLAASKIAPRTVNFPAGTRLSPDTPFEINQIIPGQRIDVAFDDLCIQVRQSFRLQGMTYELTPEGEAISLDLGSINTITGEI